MFFTQEDYKKIKKYLYHNSIKDTDMQEAMDIKGNETVSIVQEGKNVKMCIRDFINSIHHLLPENIINVSEDYHLGDTTLEEAIHIVVPASRRSGTLITFLQDNVWRLYQFEGVPTQWNDTTFWKDFTDPLNIKKLEKSSDRPKDVKIGFTFFDTSLSPARMIVWNGSAWVNMDGTPLE